MMAAGGAGELGLSRSRGSCPSKTCLGAGGTAVYHGACAIDRQDTHKLGRCSPWAKNLLPVVAMNCALCVDQRTLTLEGTVGARFMVSYAVPWSLRNWFSKGDTLTGNVSVTKISLKSLFVRQHTHVRVL